jgi:hypothetical protein
VGLIRKGPNRGDATTLMRGSGCGVERQAIGGTDRTRAARGVPEHRVDADRPLRQLTSLTRSHRHQDGHLTGLRAFDKVDPDAGLYRRRDQSRRACYGDDICGC